MQDELCFSEHAACKVCVFPSLGGCYQMIPRHAERAAMVPSTCRGPALRANSLTHHGGWYHRRSVSPAWQYVP